MAEIALGWLHWSEEQLYDADMNAIMVGYRGMQKMLTSIFGEPKKVIGPRGKGRNQPAEQQTVDTQGGAPIKLTPKLFDQMFAGNKGGKKRKPN